MIRYVPIEDHGFAFLDTVTMRFIEVGGDQTFSDVADLREAGGDQRLVEMAEAAAERKPSAGWVDKGVSGWRFVAGPLAATVHRLRDHSQVFLTPTSGVGRIGEAIVVESVDVEPAQLAAEDALLAIAAEIVGAVGR